nr:ASCH domain-containing protein [Bradyrhizobium sp. SZCCHNR2012]
MKVKGISIRQPYAWLVVSGLKPIENRSQNTRHRGRLLILASQKMHAHSVRDVSRRYSVEIPTLLPMGGIIGEVDLVDVVTSSRSKWFEGPFGLVLENARIWPKLVPYNGKLGLFDVEL